MARSAATTCRWCLPGQRRFRASGTAPAPNPQADARADYELALQIGNKDALSAFLAQYPDGFYSRLARLQLDKIAANNAAANPSAAGPSTPEKPQGDKAGTNLASLSPPPVDLAKSVQTELRRVGCLAGSADGDWNAASQRSLALFNRYAGTKFNVKLASIEALDAIKLKPARVCPLVCEHGFKPDGDHCSKIVCTNGSFLNDDNECEKRPGKTPTAKRDDGDRPDRAAYERPRPEARTAKPEASGQIVCNTGGCRPVARGCHLEYKTFAQGGPYEGQGGNVEVCR